MHRPRQDGEVRRRGPGWAFARRVRAERSQQFLQSGAVGQAFEQRGAAERAQRRVGDALEHLGGEGVGQQLACADTASTPRLRR